MASSTNRRSLIAGLAAAPVAAATMMAADASAAEPIIANADLWALLDAHDRNALRLNKIRDCDVEWAAWEAESKRLYALAEALPLRPENAAVKARAITSIYSEAGWDTPWEDDTSTSGRLGRQIVQCLAGGLS